MILILRQAFWRILNIATRRQQFTKSLESLPCLLNSGTLKEERETLVTLEWLYSAMRFRLCPRRVSYRIQRACQIRSYASQVTFEPLRVLFCGSDEFSIASLRALHKEHERDKALIESIDVVSRPPKLVGRGFKDTREGEFSQAGPPCFILN